MIMKSLSAVGQNIFLCLKMYVLRTYYPLNALSSLLYAYSFCSEYYGTFAGYSGFRHFIIFWPLLTISVTHSLIHSVA